MGNEIKTVQVFGGRYARDRKASKEIVKWERLGYELVQLDQPRYGTAVLTLTFRRRH